MYSCLDDYGKKTNLITDQTKFPCPSLVQQNTPNFYNYEYLDTNQTERSYNNREYFIPDDLHPKWKIDLPKKEPKIDASIGLTTSLPSYKGMKEKVEKKEHLLPVLDSNFNLREICKQCILLEDHLTQKEKRCEDCCIKHFLAIEALSEEALGLDKNQKLLEKIEDLPNKVRKIQKKWLENKNRNAHDCSQMLRSIRKSLMEDCFSVIFDSDQKCDGKKCKI